MKPLAAFPFWSSAFRPFYFLGALYAPLLAAIWIGAILGVWEGTSVATPLRLWHGHEMLFGFSAAIIVGILLTALPSWAGTTEIRGGKLVLLVTLWLAGRLAFWAAPWLPVSLVAAVDCALFPVVALMLAPQLLRARNRFHLLLLPILAALYAGNAAFYVGQARGSEMISSQGLRLTLYAVILLYVLKGGVLAPIFTDNALRAKGRGQQKPFSMPLEFLALAVAGLLAVLDLAAAPAAWTGSAALACALVHGWRTLRWKGWRVVDVPLVFVMHLGFAWLVFAFALKAVADLAGLIPEPAWMHAFTVGSLGMMMLGLMTRVSLRHTGRPLDVPRPMQIAWGVMLAAALLRLATTVHGLGNWAMALAAALWAAPFVIYLALFGALLLRPSLPKSVSDR